MNGSQPTPVFDASANTQNALHAALRFVRVVRYRKSYVVAALLVAAALGTVYYVTATRVYQATAAVLVLQSSESVFQSSSSVDDRSQALIPTYERLFSSSPVLKGAVEQLRKLPADVLIDFEKVSPDDWEGVLRANVSAKSARR